MTSPIGNIDNTTLLALSDNLDIGDVANPALRLTYFQYLNVYIQTITTAFNALVMNGAIGSVNLADLSVLTAKIAELAVTTSKIADLAVTTAKLNDMSVTLVKMAENSVGTTQLVDLSVTNDKVANGTLTAAKFVEEALTNDTQNGLRITELQADLMYQGTASRYGLVPTGLNQLAALNTYFDDLSDNGIKYANFDKPGAYVAPGTISSAYKIIMTGNAEIDQSIGFPENWFLNISKSRSSFNGKINSFSVQNMKSSYDNGIFKQFMRALSQNRNIKISFMGDSITSGDDEVTEYNTRLVDSATNGIRYNNVNGIVNDGSYPYRFMDMLKDSFPSSTFEMTNYGISGEKISSWDASFTRWGATKNWIDFLKDATPDVLFVAFGMNHNDLIEAKTFAYDLKSLIAYVQANFSPVPDIVVVPTPRPVYATGDASYGDYINQASRFIVANAARAIGKEYGAYVCDVAKLSDIKRAGLDYTRPIIKNMSLSDFTETLTSVTNNGDGTYSFTDGVVGKIQLKGTYLKDFVIVLRMTFTAGVANSSNSFSINFNKVANTNFYDNRVIIAPRNISSVAVVKTAMRISDSASWGSSGVTGTYTEATNYNGTEVTFVLSKRGNKIELRKVGVDTLEYVYIEDYADVLDAHGFIELLNEPQVAGNNVAIASIQIYGADYPEYLPTLTEDDMFGGYVSGNTDTKEPYGGNGVNHPSSKGIAEVYEPPLRELVDDIVSMVADNNRNNLLGLFPVTETLSSTTTGAFSYINVNTKILSTRLVTSGGTVFTLNKNITAFSGGSPVGGALAANEFGMYMTSATAAQLIINSAAAAGWAVTTYK